MPNVFVDGNKTTLSNGPDMVTANRAAALTTFMDEMTEQVHFSVRKFGIQKQTDLLQLIEAQAERLQDLEATASAEGAPMDKQARLEACLAIAVLAFRCHYGE